MSLKRTEIRKQVELLLNGNTDAGTSVWPTRARELNDEMLPAILIYTNSEQVELFEEAPRRYRRTLELEIQVITLADEYCDDALDLISNQVERILGKNDDLQGLVESCDLSSVVMGVFDNGSTLRGASVLTFDVVYYDENPTYEEFDKDTLERLDTTIIPATKEMGETPAATDQIDLDTF